MTTPLIGLLTVHRGEQGYELEARRLSVRPRSAKSYDSTPSLFSAVTSSAPMPSQVVSTSALC